MTSEKVMFSGRWALMVLMFWTAFLGGCDLLPKETIQPQFHRSPYLPSRMFWAVAPFRNETGTTLADGVRFSEQLTQHLQQSPGMSVAPTNRVLQAMAALGIAEIHTYEQVTALMQILRVDALVVGSLTSWDPYDSIKIGGSMQLFMAARARAEIEDMTTRRLTASTTDLAQPLVNPTNLPVNQYSFHYDAANGTVIKNLKDYAHGRVPESEALGHERYLLTIDLFSEFCSHEMMRGLYRVEWERLEALRQAAAAAAVPDKK